MYKIYNWCDDRWKFFSDWWDLIKWFSEADPALHSVAHKQDDIYSFYDFKFNRKPEGILDYEDDIVEKAKTIIIMWSTSIKLFY